VALGDVLKNIIANDAAMLIVSVLAQ